MYEPYVVITKRWLLCFAGRHFAQSKGRSLTAVRYQFRDSDKVFPGESGKGYRTPELLREWFLGKIEALVAANMVYRIMS